MNGNGTTRRVFLRQGGLFLSLAAALGPAAVWARAEAGAEPEISPVEDLMQEHGVLRRVLLIYADIDRRVQAGLGFPMATLEAAAGIVHDFVENYHEQVEEEHVFPYFEGAGRMVPLVKILRQQHQAGRRITRYLQTQVNVGLLLNEQNRRELSRYLRAFMGMYQPHAAREDTVLFLAFRSLMPARDYQELGEKFEQIEHEKFGEQGFQKVVDRVAELEQTLGIHDLAQFTPHLPG